MFSIALLLLASLYGHAEYAECVFALDDYGVDLPRPIPNPEFENPEAEDLEPSEEKPLFPQEQPVIDPAPAPVDTPLESPEPLERPPDER